jgi:large subunit ribosomal protein L19
MAKKEEKKELSSKKATNGGKKEMKVASPKAKASDGKKKASKKKSSKPKLEKEEKKPTSKKKISSKKSKKNEKPGKLAMADKVRPGYLVKVVHLSPDGKRNFTTQGVVMRVRGEGQNKTFTVRTTVSGVGMEKVFSFASPVLEEIEVLKKKLARRARLYFLRGKNVTPAKKAKYLKGL